MYLVVREIHVHRSSGNHAKRCYVTGRLRRSGLAVRLALNGEDILADQRPYRDVRVARLQLGDAVQCLQLDHARALNHLSALQQGHNVSQRKLHVLGVPPRLNFSPMVSRD